MSVVASPEIVRDLAERQAVALLNLSPEQIGYVGELRQLFHDARGERERAEIVAAFVELIWPEGIAKVGIPENGVSPKIRRDVAAYHHRVGREIRRRRQAKEMTQKQLAGRAGIPQSHVSRLESGKHTPTYLTINRIAKALGTKPKLLDPGFED